MEINSNQNQIECFPMISRSIRHLSSFLVTLLVFIQCEYSPTGSNFQEKEIPEPIIYIDLNNSADTVSAWGFTTLAYDLNLLGRDFYGGELLLDSVLIHSFTQLKGSYSLNTYDFVQDTLSLIIRGVSKTGSNSLADIVGAEYLSFELEYILTIDNRPPRPLFMKGISTRSGDMVISWEKFNRNGFIRYNIDKGQAISGGNIDERHLTSVFDGNTTTVIDSTYLGGPAYYRVNVISALGQSQGEYFYYIEGQPVFYPSTDTNYSEIPMHWTPCLYPQNFSKYEITKDDNTIFSTGDINNTSFVDSDVAFGDPIGYTLDVVFKNNYIWSHNLHDSFEAYLGLPFPYPGSLQFCAVTGSIYRQYGNTIYRMDAESYANLDSLTLDSEVSYFCFGISPNGQYAYVTNYINGTGYIHQIDPLTLTAQQTWTTSALLGYNGRAIHDLSVSNTNRITLPSFMEKNYSNWGMGVVVMDMNDPIQVINPNYAYGTNSEISANGQYLIAYDTLYQIGENTLTEIAGLGQWVESLFIGEGNQLLVSTPSSITTYDANDFSVVSQVNAPDRLRNPYFDPVTSLVGGLFRSEGRYIVIDPSTGATVQDLSASSTKLYRFWDNTIFTSGYRLSLEALGN
jgi:hypothetical protein